jgi:hypothetical protein
MKNQLNAKDVNKHIYVDPVGLEAGCVAYVSGSYCLHRRDCSNDSWEAPGFIYGYEMVKDAGTDWTHKTVFQCGVTLKHRHC